MNKIYLSCLCLLCLIAYKPISGQSVLESKLLASDGEPGDQYGGTVSVSGDRIVSGSRWDDDNGSDSGSIYVNSWDGSNWVESKIIASDGAMGDEFGYSVSVSGDRIVAGSRFNDENAPNAGSAYIYDWDGNSWVETKIMASDGSPGEQFGFSVSISGDRVVVGTIKDGDNGPSSGSTYIYDWDGSSWIETKILPSDGSQLDFFGFSVSVSGDRILVGSRDDDDNGTNSGSVYIYDWDGSSWVETKLTASDGALHDLFGFSVSISGDRLVVGAINDDDNGSDSGSIYVYDWDGSNWIETKIVSSDGAAGDRFGNSVSVFSDRIVVGAPWEKDGVVLSGSIYIYDWDGSNWIETKVLSSDRENGDSFGWAVSVSQDYILAGALGDDENGFGSGSTYIYELGFTYYADVDGDNFGDPLNTIVASSVPVGYVTNNIDCNDTDATVFPGATELCDGQVNDCGSFLSPFEIDDDGDQYVECQIGSNAWFGSPSVIGGGDCDDSNPLVHPGTSEICDGLDNDCDGLIDGFFICNCPSGPQANTFLGNTIYWSDPANWSLGTIPTLCDDVLIPTGLTCKLLSTETGECYTLEVQVSGDFEVEQGGVMEVVAPGI